MIQNAKTNHVKIIKYIIGSLFVLSLCFLMFYNYSKKENVYLLYDDFANCEYIEEYKKKMYYEICYKHNVILCKKKTYKKIYETETIEEFKLTSKEDFFKIDYEKLKDVNLILIIKENKKFKIVTVHIVEYFEIIS